MEFNEKEIGEEKINEGDNRELYRDSLKIEFVEADDEDDETEKVFKAAMKKAFMRGLANCTFYLYPLHIDPNVIFDEKDRGEICAHFAERIGARGYVIRYGADIRNALKLKEEFANKQEENVNIISADLVTGEMTMLNEEQRALFFNAVKNNEEDIDILEILLEILYNTEEEGDDNV